MIRTRRIMLLTLLVLTTSHCDGDGGSEVGAQMPLPATPTLVAVLKPGQPPTTVNPGSTDGVYRLLPAASVIIDAAVVFPGDVEVTGASSVLPRAQSLAAQRFSEADEAYYEASAPADASADVVTWRLTVVPPSDVRRNLTIPPYEIGIKMVSLRSGLSEDEKRSLPLVVKVDGPVPNRPIGNGPGPGGTTPPPTPTPRTPGAFVEITEDVLGRVDDSRTCPNGSVRLEVRKDPAGYSAPFLATFVQSSDGQPIAGPTPFRRDNASVGGVGGTGFAKCTVGVVVDGDAMQYVGHPFLLNLYNLSTGKLFPSSGFGFNYGFPDRSGNFAPRLLVSHDGTIIGLVAAATIGPNKITAVFFDALTGRKLRDECGIQEVMSDTTVVAEVTTSNEVEFSFMGRNCTIGI